MYQSFRLVTLLITTIILFMTTLFIQEKTLAATNTATVIDYPAEIKPDNTLLLLNNISYELVLIHIKIGNMLKISGASQLKASSDILLTISNSEMLVKKDIIENLKNANDKTQTFQDDLWKINATLDEGSFFMMLLTQNIANLTTQKNACTQEKKISDKNYFESIQSYNQENMVISLQQSSAANECIAKATMEINAQNVLLGKLSFYHKLLQEKFDFLSSKQELIIKNIDFLDPSFLQELINIKQTLDTFYLK